MKHGGTFPPEPDRSPVECWARITVAMNAAVVARLALRSARTDVERQSAELDRAHAGEIIMTELERLAEAREMFAIARFLARGLQG